MRLRSAMLMLTLALLGAITSGPALADHGHFHSHARIGVFIGAPLAWPWYYPYYPYYPAPYYYPYYPYYPPAVAVPSSPPVYIERGDGQTAAPQSSYWYYCANPQGYYPYVKECPGGWQRVTPQPTPPS